MPRSTQHHSSLRGHWWPRSDSHARTRRAPRDAARVCTRAGRHWRGDPSLTQRDATLAALGPGPRTARDRRRAHRNRLLAIRHGRARRAHALGLAHGTQSRCTVLPHHHAMLHRLARTAPGVRICLGAPVRAVQPDPSVAGGPSVTLACGGSALCGSRRRRGRRQEHVAEGRHGARR